MNNITGELKNYEQMADNYVKPTEKNKSINNVVEKNTKEDKEFKKLINKINKDYQLMRDNLELLRELKAMKELYDASTSLQHFNDSIKKVELIYN